MEAQFDALWDSGAWMNVDGTTGIAKRSGIYQLCLNAFLNRSMPGACKPTSGEVPSQDWQGTSILYQTLSNGYHAEWYENGQGHLYDPFNKRVA